MIFEVLGRRDWVHRGGEVLSVLICCAPAWCLEKLMLMRGEREYQDTDHLSILSVWRLASLLECLGLLYAGRNRAINLLLRQNIDVLSTSWGFRVFDLPSRHAAAQATLIIHTVFCPRP